VILSVDSPSSCVVVGVAHLFSLPTLLLLDLSSPPRSRPCIPFRVFSFFYTPPSPLCDFLNRPTYTRSPFPPMPSFPPEKEPPPPLCPPPSHVTSHQPQQNTHPPHQSPTPTTDCRQTRHASLHPPPPPPPHKQKTSRPTPSRAVGQRAHPVRLVPHFRCGPPPHREISRCCLGRLLLRLLTIVVTPKCQLWLLLKTVPARGCFSTLYRG